MKTQGMMSLIRFCLRRDRLYLPLWIVGLVALAVFFTPMLPDMVGDQASIEALVQTMENPAMVAICGPSFGSEATMGSLYAQFMLLWVACGFAVFNLLFVVRHSRADEERGRLEMLGALPVGRNANLLATLAVVFAADLLMAVLISCIQPFFGLESIDLTGSLVYGFALATCGFCFAGLAAVCAQLASSSRAATGLALALLGLAYLLRASGDISGSALSFISPLGLALQSQAYVGNLYWPPALLALEGLVAFALAVALQTGRDSGRGLVPERRGRAHASALLRGEWSLALRQLRGLVLAWVVTCLILSAAYGSVMGDMNSFIENNEMYQMLMGVTPGMTSADLTDPVISMLMLIMAIIATIPVVSVINHLVAEERRGRLEQLLAKTVLRPYLFAGYLLVAVVAAVLTQLANALGFWLVATATLPEALDLGMVLTTCFNYLPAQLAFAGLAALLAGLLPRLTGLTWAYLVYAFMSFYLGRMVDIPEAALKASPFGILPAYPTQDIDPLVTVALLAAFALLSIAGALAWRRRDIGK
jgi:ABC-2 type transport system permease protein